MWDSFGFEFINYYFVPGLVLGCIYALGAIGITLTFGILRFANFAHGEIMMTGAFLTWTFLELSKLTFGFYFHPLIACIPSIFIAIALALSVDRFFYRPFRDSPTIMIVMASFGMMLIIRSLVQVIWGPNQITFVKGIAKPNGFLRDLSGSFDMMLLVPSKHIFIILGTVIIMDAFNYMLTKTRIGKAMRAVSDSPDLAKVTGIDVEQVIRATWFVGGFCAVMAGVFMAMDTQFIMSTMGFRMLLPMFAAAILGGIGRPFGAVLGGLVIGFAEELSAYPWFGDEPLLSPGYKSGVAFSILVIMLIFRPSGILKGRVF